MTNAWRAANCVRFWRILRKSASSAKRNLSETFFDRTGKAGRRLFGYSALRRKRFRSARENRKESQLIFVTAYERIRDPGVRDQRARYLSNPSTRSLLKGGREAFKRRKSEPPDEPPAWSMTIVYFLIPAKVLFYADLDISHICAAAIIRNFFQRLDIILLEKTLREWEARLPEKLLCGFIARRSSIQ